MATIAWLISICAFMGGLAVKADLPFAHAHDVGNVLLAISVFACPLLWDNWMARALLPGKQRLMACIALVVFVPVILLS
ncbi:hypothetical protein [Sphingobium subterraneum]|uniref:Uncharacterized protein n=1 Tax=Sphingobium subterraneum TaxID=627688 RepID=A0A841J6A9_9SPHN|nr:hypothetical protein [Sphingobium subterraneum]MBB6124068.1 hypothetical protein [Sphingobium subterraneum]